MRITKKLVAVVSAASFAAIGGGVLVSSQADAAEVGPMTASSTAGSIPNTKGAVTNWNMAKASIYGDNLGPGMVQWFTTVYNGSVHEIGLDANLKAKINKPGITGLESDSPYPSATQLSDNPGQGANSTVKFVGDSGATLQRAWVQCADGKTAIGGGYQRADEAVAAIKNLQIVSSSPTQVKDGKEVYEPIAGDKAGSLKPNAWLVEGFNNGTTDLIVRPSVVCANIG
ncbi:hypothetical protein EV138_0877 [Kribbella voronezhensis]|uniref:Uncharacterized protein n=1 Tax=Kribbella voronezhensis TaxID=2512212 RepID=A0A4R7T7U0_9ACTN|nr:hypothetical protein [Kribbella voronezhensis]TDU87356.1 hypothetical protein EV138_0877 [Kribbella voronezhensis]